MKTLIYLPALFIFFFQVIVKGQTNGNQSHKIRVDIMGSKESKNNPISEIGPVLFISQLRSAALTALPNEKKLLLMEASEQEEALISGQIQKSMDEANFTYERFKKNKTIILTLLVRVSNDSYIVTQVNILEKEADFWMRQATQMREEAKAQLYLAAVLGEMSNAEEKEVVAITLQNNTIKLLENTGSEISYATK